MIALTDCLKASDEDLQTMGFADVRLTESARLVHVLGRKHLLKK